MKRALFALPLLALVLPAQAQGSFCNGLAQLVVAAPDYFEPLPTGRYIPGSQRELRSTTPRNPRGVYIAIMGHGSHAAMMGRFDSVVREVQHCLPGRTPAVENAGQERAATWRLERAAIRVALTGNAQQADVQIMVVDRW